MRDILSAFMPNKIVSAKTMAVLLVAQVATVLIIWFNSPFEVLPKPMEILAAFSTLWLEQGLSREIWTSLVLNAEALALTLLVSLCLSYLTVLPVMRPVVVMTSKGRFLGLVGLSFAFTLMVGGGHPLKVALLVFGMSVFFVTSMAAEVAAIPKESFDHARTLRMSEWRVVWEVVILGTRDRAIEVLRQNAAIGWMMLTMVEGISRSEGGVGAMLLAQNKHFHLSAVFAVQLTILAIGLVQDYAIGAFKRFACPYAHLELERR